MKRMILITLAILFVLNAIPALAAEEMTLTPNSVEFRKDKNGKEYAVLIFSSTKKSPSGMSYTESIVGTIPAWETSALTAAKSLKANQPAKFMVNKSQYNGNDTYRIVACAPLAAGK